MNNYEGNIYDGGINVGVCNVNLGGCVAEAGVCGKNKSGCVGNMQVLVAQTRRYCPKLCF